MKTLGFTPVPPSFMQAPGRSNTSLLRFGNRAPVSPAQTPEQAYQNLCIQILCKNRCAEVLCETADGQQLTVGDALLDLLEKGLRGTDSLTKDGPTALKLQSAFQELLDGQYLCQTKHAQVTVYGVTEKGFALVRQLYPPAKIPKSGQLYLSDADSPRRFTQKTRWFMGWLLKMSPEIKTYYTLEKVPKLEPHDHSTF
jgi:hypothetical protein